MLVSNRKAKVSKMKTKVSHKSTILIVGQRFRSRIGNEELKKGKEEGIRKAEISSEKKRAGEENIIYNLNQWR